MNYYVGCIVRDQVASWLANASYQTCDSIKRLCSFLKYPDQGNLEELLNPPNFYCHTFQNKYR